LLLTPSNTP
jgi:hypothetical protein